MKITIRFIRSSLALMCALRTVLAAVCLCWLNTSYSQPNAQACPTANTSGITNFCVVTSDKLWRGSKPDAQGAAWLIDNGVSAIVNLELLNDDLTSIRAAKTKAQTNAELNYFRVRDWEPLVVIAPGIVDKHVTEFISIAITQPGPIYVHCRSGQNRTGIMVAAYRIVLENLPVEKAIAEMTSYQGIWSKQDAAYLRTFTRAKSLALLSKAQSMAKSIKPRTRIRCSDSICT
jgi:protein tyrosine phosphatase (PTP) superfamily phosphohydrolase (DUF442 family)